MKDSKIIELSALAAEKSGVVIDGAEADDGLGISVSGAGDVNGDGMADLIIGASTASPNGDSSGQAYVIFGKSDSSQIKLHSLGTSGFVINGISAIDHEGQSVSGAGDVNGDGRADLIIGAPNADPNGRSSGQSYVVFGKNNNEPVQLKALGTSGFVINGVAEGDFSGSSVSGAGDVNGDGIADVIIGSPFANSNGDASGQSYVVFGKNNNDPVELRALGTGGFVINGIRAGDLSGSSVSGAGDVNGDGKADLLIGAPGSYVDGNLVGQSYVVFGKNDNNPVDLRILGTGGFTIDGAIVNGKLGYSVSGAGDVNGDGKADVVIGAPIADPNGLSSGQSYVVFGKDDNNTVKVKALGTDGFIINGAAEGDQSGYSVSGAGDINGDGKADVIIGAPGANPKGLNSGQSYVVFGKSDNLPLELKTLGVNGFTINGAAEGDASGSSVCGAGDFNGDGTADLVIGAPDAYHIEPPAGQSYLVYGPPPSKALSSSTLALLIAAPVGGFLLLLLVLSLYTYKKFTSGNRYRFFQQEDHDQGFELNLLTQDNKIEESDIGTGQDNSSTTDFTHEQDNEAQFANNI